MKALLTDLYELTMAAGFVAQGKQRDIATFEMFVRKLPGNRRFLVAAGLAQALEYLTGLRFTVEEISFLRGLPQFAHAPEEFFGYLAEFRFTGDVFAVPEGTPMFAGEPILTVRAPIAKRRLWRRFCFRLSAFRR